MGQARNLPTQRTTLCVQPVLCCPLWPCDHRMCVIAKGTGLSPLARTCSRIWTFPRRLHVSAHHDLDLRPFTSETSIQKLAIFCSLKHGCSRCVLQCVFPAPPGARQSLTEAGEDDQETDNSSNISQNYFSEHEPTTVIMKGNTSTALVTQDIKLSEKTSGQVAFEPFGFSVKIVPTKKIHENKIALVLIICSAPPHW